MVLCGYSAYPRVIDFHRFREIADEVGAILMADIAHIAGLVAAGVHPSPFPHAQVVTTTTHKTLRGPRGGMILSNDPELATKIDKAVFPGMQGGPLMHTIAAKAVAFGEDLKPEFKTYAKQVVTNAQALAEGLKKAGYRIVSGGTDNHLLLVDLTGKGVAGKPAAKALDRAGIELNYNTVPFDPRKPFDPSGIRLGTAAVTSRGMTTDDTTRIADWIAQVVEAERAADEASVEKIGAAVRDFARAFPMPGLP
jgi:glycine hydroxymethyltransferase